jgi:uncharacterized protein
MILTWQGPGDLLAILLHASFDVLVGPVGQLFPAPVVTSYGGALPMLIGLGVTAVLLVASTRGELGYQNYRQDGPDSAAALRKDEYRI